MEPAMMFFTLSSERMSVMISLMDVVLLLMSFSFWVGVKNTKSRAARAAKRKWFLNGYGANMKKQSLSDDEVGFTVRWIIYNGLVLRMQIECLVSPGKNRLCLFVVKVMGCFVGC